MLLHFIINSLLVFLGLNLAIGLFLRLFKVSGRLAAFLRLLPFAKLPFDFLVFSCLGGSLFINLNPFSCEIYVCDLLAKTFFPSLLAAPNSHLILPQYVAQLIPPLYLALFAILAASLALIGAGLKVARLIASRIYLRKLVRLASPCSRPILNDKLRESIEKRSIQLLVSSQTPLPFALGKEMIVLPEKLMEPGSLTQEEFESVIAHEQAHLKWRDPLFKQLLSFLSSLCWWLPMKKALIELIDEQERAADGAVLDFGIERKTLASAITTIAEKTRQESFQIPAICLFQGSHTPSMRRVQELLSLKKPPHIALTLLATLTCLFAFMSLWMC